MSVYSWVVSYWIVYHRLTPISPYRNIAIFFFDVASFTILLFILLISFHIAPDFYRFLEFILSFAIIHIIGGAIAYITSIKQEQSKKNKLIKYSLLHFGWASAFFGYNSGSHSILPATANNKGYTTTCNVLFCLGHHLRIYYHQICNIQKWKNRPIISIRKASCRQGRLRL